MIQLYFASLKKSIKQIFNRILLFSMIRGTGFTCLVAFQFLFLNLSTAQNLPENSIEQLIVRNAALVYFQSLGEQSGIYRGTEYTGYPYRIKEGHQFFESADFGYGSVSYDGILYENVPLWYDIVKNQVLVRYVDEFSRIVLHDEKIDYFTLHNHHFIHIKSDDLKTASLPPGFYDLVYNGAVEVLVNRSKGTLKDVSVEGTFIIILKQKNYFFLKKGEIYYPVESLGSVLKVLGSKQKEIQEFLKKSNIKFRKDPENTIVRIVKYYDLLTEIK